MIKKTKINELINNRVILALDTVLSNHDFKFFKSKKSFVRNHKEYEHIIKVTPSNTVFEYYEDNESLLFNFDISLIITFPKFEKWFESKTKIKTHYSEITQLIKSYIKLDISEDFNRADYYQIVRNTNVVVKSNSSLDETIELGTLIKNKLEEKISNLELRSNIKSLFEISQYPMKTNIIALLIYGGYNEKAISLIQSRYEIQIKRFQESKDKGESISHKVKQFQEFLDIIYFLADIKLVNPFLQEVKCLKGNNTLISLSEKTRYKEVLKVAKTDIEIKHYLLNPRNGEFILLLDNGLVVKFNKFGEKLLEFTLKNPPNYSSTWHFAMKYIEDTDCFFINNCIVTPENEVVYILDKKWNNKQLISNDITYSLKKKEFTIKCKIIANRVIPDIIECTLASSFEIKNIREQTKNGCYLLGELNNLKNGKIKKSKSGHYAIWYGNGTKSIIYNLLKENKKVVYAHPTSQRGYIDTIYPDRPKNFDITNAVFSSDNKFVITSSYYGKITAWKLTNYERIELIPNKKFIDILEYAQIFTINNNKYFKWSNGVFGAFVLELNILQNSELFLTQTDKVILVWNNKFENVGLIEGLGRVKLHSDKYLTEFKENELKIYELQNNL